MENLYKRLLELEMDVNAVPVLDVLCDAFVWSDERIYEITDDELVFLRRIFKYRTSVLVGEERVDLKPFWNELRNACPGWIGFRFERCFPSESLSSRYRGLGQELLGD